MSNQQRRLYMQPTTSKPKVYKIVQGGHWWAKARDNNGKAHFGFFNTHEAALAKAVNYAAGVFE